MEEEIYLKARAKVNLTLNILDKRQDGYHNLKSVFQKINFYDELFIKKCEGNSLILKSNIQNVKFEDNIITKAYEKMQAEFPQITGVEVELNKNIPMQAGLAGGSTDCASFIIGINKLFKLELSEIKMIEIASALGADVAPCLYNTVVMAEGIGDVITKVDTNFKYYFVIIKPEFASNTKEMYKKIDEMEVKIADTTEEMSNALKKGNIEEVCASLSNSFEEVLKHDTQIVKAKKVLQENGAKGVMLAGSGSCVFGIFENKTSAKQAYDNLKNTYEAYVCTSYNSRRNGFE